jgi:hypothetical protein
MQRYPRATELATSALDFYTQSGNVLRRSEALRILGDIDARQGDAARARQRYTEALALATFAAAPMEAEIVRQRLAALDGGDSPPGR